MMKVFKSILLFIMTSALPGLIFYALFEGLVLLIIASLWFVVWCVGFIYLDRLILLLMGAREIIDVNHQYIFQAFKSEGYKNSERPPKVFLYNGSLKKLFILESRNEWTVLLDRKLVEELSQEEVFHLVRYAYQVKRMGMSWYQTKAMGLCAISLKIVSFILRRIFMLKPTGSAYRVLTIFFLSLIRPLVGPIEYYAKKAKSIETNEGLKAIYYEITDTKESVNYSTYLSSYLEYGDKENIVLRKYLEGFPVIENCTFVG